MDHLLNVSLLIAYGFLPLLSSDPDFSFLFAFLCTVILASGSYILEAGGLRFLLALAFLSGAVFSPAFCLFFPASFYVFLWNRHQGQKRLLLPSLLAAVFLFHIYYQRDISARLAVFLLFGLALAFLLHFFTARFAELDLCFRRIQDDSRENHLLLSEKNKMLLEKQDYEIYNAILRERNRIAREIHDNVGHVLSRSILIVGAAKALNKEAALSPVLSNLELSLKSAMDSIRESVHDLHDESIPLKEAVGSLLLDFSYCPVEFQYDMGYVLPPKLKYCFLGITKEALSNIARHSNATKVSILMREHPALYQLHITDNGTFYSPDRPGIGLPGMKERVLSLNGMFRTAADNGFQIFVTIPKTNDATASPHDPQKQS